MISFDWVSKLRVSTVWRRWIYCKANIRGCSENSPEVIAQETALSQHCLSTKICSLCSSCSLLQQDGETIRPVSEFKAFLKAVQADKKSRQESIASRQGRAQWLTDCSPTTRYSSGNHTCRRLLQYSRVRQRSWPIDRALARCCMHANWQRNWGFVGCLQLKSMRTTMAR